MIELTETSAGFTMLDFLSLAFKLLFSVEKYTYGVCSRLPASCSIPTSLQNKAIFSTSPAAGDFHNCFVMIFDDAHYVCVIFPVYTVQVRNTPARFFSNCIKSPYWK